MKTEFLTQHCNNILEMRAICTLPPRIIERLNLSSIKRWKNDIFSNEILLFLLGPACAEGLSIPLTVTSISLPGSSFCCLLHSLSILSRIFLQLQGHLHLADLPSGWSGYKHRPQAACMALPSQPHPSVWRGWDGSAILQQSHLARWQNSNEQSPGISCSQLYLHKAEETPQKWSSTAIALWQQDILYTTSKCTLWLILASWVIWYYFSFFLPLDFPITILWWDLHTCCAALYTEAKLERTYRQINMPVNAVSILLCDYIMYAISSPTTGELCIFLP